MNEFFISVVLQKSQDSLLSEQLKDLEFKEYKEFVKSKEFFKSQKNSKMQASR